MPSIVVTGASGFLGGAVVRALRAQGLTVLPVSRKSLPDALCVADYAEAPSGDILLHFAGENDRAKVNARGEAYLRETESLANALVAKNYALPLFVSSAVVYGDQSEIPHREEDPVYTQDVYSRAKRAGEAIFLAQAGGCVVRPANLYGPGLSQASVVARVVAQVGADHNNPLIINDDKPVRDFLWIEDAAACFCAIVRHFVVNKGVSGIYNLGSGKGCSIGHLARQALDVAGQSDRRIEVTAPSPQRSSLVLDSRKAQTAFGWGPQTDLAEGLRRLIYRQQGNNDRP